VSALVTERIDPLDAALPGVVTALRPTGSTAGAPRRRVRTVVSTAAAAAARPLR
jgi:hypothetical protein